MTGITIATYMYITAGVIDLSQRYEAGEFLVLSRLADAEETLDTALAFTGLAYFAAAVAFLFWIHRASRNLQPLGAPGQRFSPGWAVGWWFVPIMFFIRPYQIMAEILKGSAPGAPREATLDWQADPVSALLKWWWALWLASNLVGFAVVFAESSDVALDLLGNALALCDAVLAIAVVWRITKRQDEKHRRMISGTS